MAEGTSDSIIDGESLTSINKDEEIICDPCKEDGNNIPAHGFCVDCNEYLCDNCYSGHLKPRPCRNHVLQDSTQMPRRKSEEIASTKGVISFKCHVHPTMEITSYCKTDDKLCCKECVAVFHCVCKDVCLLADLVAEESVETEINKFEESLVEVTKIYTENSQRATAHLKMIYTMYQNTMDRVEAKLRDIKSRDIRTISAIKDTSEKVLKQAALLSGKVGQMKSVNDNVSRLILILD